MSEKGTYEQKLIILNSAVGVDAHKDVKGAVTAPEAVKVCDATGRMVKGKLRAVSAPSRFYISPAES